MSQVTIDAAKKIGEAIIADAVVEKTTRDTLTLRFATPAAREQASVLISLLSAQRGVTTTDVQGHDGVTRRFESVPIGAVLPGGARSTGVAR